MSLFDPIGLIGHFKVKVLMFLQSRWRSRVGWDDEVPDEVFTKWTIWINCLKGLENISISKQYAPALQEAEIVEIHTFVDASAEAYLAVCYLRVQKGSLIHVTLVALKNCFSPMQTNHSTIRTSRWRAGGSAR